MTGQENKNHSYSGRVAFYDTDAMGVVHHSNYVKYIENARVMWLRESGLSQYHATPGGIYFAVLDCQVKYLRPLRFEDEFLVRLQVCQEGARIRFQYGVYNQKTNELVATAMTLHAALNEQLKPCRLPQPVREILEKEKWIETWHLSL
jgi:acyl-CoA thioester hydrolase